MAKSKKAVHEDYTKEQAEEFISEFSQCMSSLKKTSGEMELEITGIRNKYQEQIDKLTDSKDEFVDKLQSFAERHPDLFTKKKSLDFTHGTIGFVTHPPKLKPLKGWTWDRVTEKLEQLLPEFVRKKTEPDKEGLLANREVKNISEKFTSIGVEVVHEEMFYVKNKEEVLA